MKMIGHKAPRQNIGMNTNVFLNLLKEEIIVPFLKKESSLIVPPVVNVVKTTFGELHILKIQDGFCMSKKRRLTP